MKRIVNCVKYGNTRCGDNSKLCKYCFPCTSYGYEEKDCEDCSHHCNSCLADCSKCHLPCDNRSQDYYNPSRFI